MSEYFYNIEGKYAESGRPFVRYRDKYHSLAAAKAAASKAARDAIFNGVTDEKIGAGVCLYGALFSLVEKADYFSDWKILREHNGRHDDFI